MTGKQIEKRFNAFKTAVAILIALALAFIVIALISDTPVKAITTLIYNWSFAEKIPYR